MTSTVEICYYVAVYTIDESEFFVKSTVTNRSSVVSVEFKIIKQPYNIILF